MNNKKKWTISFLGITALALILEVFSAFDGDPDTQPWTFLIVNNIPSWITYSVFSGVFLWLIPHFIKYYKIKKQNGKV